MEKSQPVNITTDMVPIKVISEFTTTRSYIMAAIVLLILTALTHLPIAPCQASSHYAAYETISRHVEGNNELTADKTYIMVDTDGGASTAAADAEREMTNHLDEHNRLSSTDTIPTASKALSKRFKARKSAKNSWLHKHNMIGNDDYDSSSLNSISGHQSFYRASPRSVESPSLSVDSGLARSGGPSVRLANGIKKFFSVEEGHYSDMYDRIDKHKPLKKKKPAERIDERLGLVH